MPSPPAPAVQLPVQQPAIIWQALPAEGPKSPANPIFKPLPSGSEGAVVQPLLWKPSPSNAAPAPQPFWQVLSPATKFENSPSVQWKPVAPALKGVGAANYAPVFKPLAAGQLPTAGPVRWLSLAATPGSGQAKPIWRPVVPGELAGSLPSSENAAPSARRPPTSQEEAQEILASYMPTAIDYSNILRLGQMATANLVEEGGGSFTFQQVSPTNGGAGEGSGNQNYAFRADLAVNSALMLSAYYTYSDDPLFTTIPSRPTQPGNLWTVYGGTLRGRLTGGKTWQLAGEGSLELFSVGSGCGGTVSCTGGGGGGYSNMFNDSGQLVFTRNFVGSLGLPFSWQATPSFQLSFVPGVSFLPTSQGASQGGAGQFYGTNFNLGLGGRYQLGNQVQLFGSAVFPFGPGNNAFDANLTYYRVPILSAGVHFAVNPRIGLEAAVTNGFGLSPSTSILAIPSANEPMLTGRFVWNPTASDSPAHRYSERQRSLTLGGLSVTTALLPNDGTNQWSINADSRGDLFGFLGYSVSNDFQFQLAGGPFNGVEPKNNFTNTYANDGGVNYRFGGKAMVYRPTRALPIWAAGSITVGRNPGATNQGYLFFQTVNTWEATPGLAFNINPKFLNSGFGNGYGLGLSANIQLGKNFQLIPELNLVAGDLGGQNGSNGTMNIRWLANNNLAVDLYTSNAAGFLDAGQLLGNGQIRFGTKLTYSF